MNKNIVETNRLMAEFVGLDQFSDQELKFHSSWDWLVMVVKEINDLYEQRIIPPWFIDHEVGGNYNAMLQSFLDVDLKKTYKFSKDIIELLNGKK